MPQKIERRVRTANRRADDRTKKGPLGWDCEAIARQLDRVYPREDGRRRDANETAVLARKLRFIESTVYRVRYQAFKARTLVPQIAGVPVGAKQIGYAIWDQYGMAKIIANYADDLPMVDVMAREEFEKLHVIGNAYQYSIPDLWADDMAGIDVGNERGMAARRAIEAGIDEIVSRGSPEGGSTGLANNPNATLVSVNFGDWDNAARTAEEILSDMRKLASTPFLLTNEMFPADTYLMDLASWDIVNSRTIGEEGTQTILANFMATNPHIKNIDSWSKLSTADAAGTGPRHIAYARDPEVMGFALPVDFTQLPPQARNLAFIVNCLAKLSGVVVRHPLGVAYMDGV